MYLHVIAIIVLSATASGETISSLGQSLTSQQLILLGRESFVKHCSGCHGESAEGNGPASNMLNPKPRNLVAGSFKLKSTPSGIPPTVSDLMRTVEQGIPGTSMPSFSELPTQERLSIVAYIRSLRNDIQETKLEQISLALPPPPKNIFTSKKGLLAAAKQGRVVYEKNCRMCHGENGLGDGPSAEGMVDSEDRPIKPANLANRFLKSGPTARDVYKALMTGFEGAPMPSYAETMKEDERWNVVAYIFYLRGRSAGIYSDKDQL